MAGQCWSQDAFQEPGVVYVVGVKTNQQVLLAQAHQLRQGSAAFDWYQPEKGHGRIEHRHYQGYPLESWQLEERWADMGLQTVIWVKHCRTKDGQSSRKAAVL